MLDGKEIPVTGSPEDGVRTAAGELEQLRAKHGVRPLNSEEEGFRLDRLPAGTFGFTYAPGQELVPLFASKTLQSFEVHKLPDGSARLVGFVTPEHLAEIERRNCGAGILLYPDPWGTATRLVDLAADAVDTARRGPSRSDGNHLMLRLLY